MAVAKKTAKPAAKATAKKTTAKTATKTVAKKTVKTATKVVAKPATSKATKSMSEMRVSGKKMIGTIQKEFTKKFPYLQLWISPYSEAESVKDKLQLTSFLSNTKIGDIRTKESAGEISINGKTLVKNLKSNFDKIFGLYAQVGFTTKDAAKYYTTHSDEMSLTQLNARGEKEGWKKGVTD